MQGTTTLTYTMEFPIWLMEIAPLKVLLITLAQDLVLEKGLMEHQITGDLSG